MESLRTDVVVAGGGVSGFIAAIAAARNGSQVLLIEKYGFLGGTLTAAMVTIPFSVFAWGERILGGIPFEFFEKLRELGGAVYPPLDSTELRQYEPGKLTFFDPELLGTVTDPEVAKYAIMEMVLAAGVQVLLHAMVVRVKKEGNAVRSLVVETKGGQLEVEGKVFIDSTGDGDVAASAGAVVAKGNSEGKLQPPTLIFRMGGVDYEKVRRFRPQFPQFMKKATANGDLDIKREDLLVFQGTPRKGEVLVNCSRVYDVDGTNPFDLTRAEIEARRQNWQIATFLRKYVPGFENAYPQDSASQIGIRETRRILGEYVLTEDDVLTGRKFPHRIAKNFWIIDIHNPDQPGTVIKLQRRGTTTYIPYECLVPLKVESLLVAGRAISTTHEAHSSIRTMGHCMAVGQAAGTAAAIMHRTGLRAHDVEIDMLQSILRAQGAIID